MQYDNRYTDQARDKSSYLTESNRSPLSSVLGGILAIAAVGTLGFGAVKSGLARPMIEKAIRNMGKYSGTEISTLSQGLKSWSANNEFVEQSLLRATWLENIRNISSSTTRGTAINQTKQDIINMQRNIETARQKVLLARQTSISQSSGGITQSATGEWTKDFHHLYSDPEFITSFKNMLNIQKGISGQPGEVATINKMHQELLARFDVTAKQKQLMEESGHQFLTLGEVMDKGMLGKYVDRETANTLQQDLEFLIKGVDSRFRNVQLDRNLLVGTSGNVADLRPMANSARLFIENVSNNFGIPFIGINPVKLFQIEKMAAPAKPLFATIEAGAIIPVVTGNVNPIAEDLYFIAGNVFSKRNLVDPLATGVHLQSANASKDIIARHLKDITGLSSRTFEELTPNDGLRYYWSKLAKMVDLGRQDVPAEAMDMFKPTTYTNIVGGVLNTVGRPYKSITKEEELKTIFGTAKWIVMKDSVRAGDVFGGSATGLDYFKQFFVSRQSAGEVTPLGLIPYIFMNRLDQGLGMMNLGLSVGNKGSAFDIYKNLMTRRIFPIMAGAALWEYGNYEAERITGIEPREEIADAYVNAKINFASLRDMTGITDFSKYLRKLTPGSEQITELPGISMLDFDKSAEELERYYQSGEDPVRKGKFWPTGNCIVPFQLIQSGYGEYKYAKDIDTNDVVITHEGILKPVIKVITRDMKDIEWTPELELYTIPFTNITTDNHPYYVVKKKECPNSCNIDCRPDRKSSYCEKELYKKCNYRKEWIPEWTLARELKVGDYVAYPRIKIIGNKDTILNMPANNDIGYLLGLYLAEGSRHSIDNNNKVYGIELCINKNEDIIRNKISRIFKQYLDLDVHIQNKIGAIKIRIFSERIGRLFDDLLYNNGDKSFIPSIYEYPKEFILGVVNGLIDGDGHYNLHKNSKSLSIAYTSSRLNYILQLRNILFTLGIENSITKHNGIRDINGTGIEKEYYGWRLYITGDAAIRLNNTLDLYKTSNLNLTYNNKASKYIVIDDNYVYIKIKNIIDNGYNGIVYDYEIQDSHSFCSISTIMHNTPFTGGKTDYYRPNWYRRMKSEYQYSDSLYGSKDEYFANAWFPTLEHPFAPVSHFITNNRWLEEKHYKDRPVPISEGINEIEGIPIFGGLLNETIGRLLKPPEKMHKEYWKGDKLVELPDTPGYEYTSEGIAYGKELERRSKDSTVASNIVTGDGISGTVGPLTRSKEIEPVEGKDVTTMAYITPSGGISVVQAPGRVNIDRVNDSLRAQSLAKTIRGVQDKYMRKDLPEAMRVVTPPYNRPLGDAVIDIQELGGIYGFAAVGMTGGSEALEWGDELATPADLDNWSDSFWETNIGGMGGETSEILRRFIPRDKNKINEYNPIRNTQPLWMPGRDYYLDLQHGDPYRMAMGEIRAPGEGYERINNLGDVMSLPARASLLGRSKEDMIKYFFHEDDVLTQAEEEATSGGTRIHKKMQSQWAKEGYLIDAEREIRDEKYNYTGHYDARVLDLSSPVGESIIDIKTVNKRKYAEIEQTGDPYEEHVGQVNAYLHTMKLPKGYIYYINRDDKEAKAIVKEVYYDPKLFQRQMETLQEARNTVWSRIESGEKQRGDLYDFVSRFKILGDIAPWSKQYQEYKALMSQVPLTDEQKLEVAETKDQVTDQKKKYRMYNYKFATANLKYEDVVVKEIIDNNTFTTTQHPDNPIRLAGIHVPTGKDDPVAKEAAEYISKTIHKGAHIKIGYDADEANMIANDTYQTIRAVVDVSKNHMTNLNRKLIEEGFAKEKDTDFTPAGVNARFSKMSIMIGSMWEKIAHADTFLNTKFLNVRSPVEQYERSEVYRKNFQDWASPIEDYLIPMYQSIIRHNPIYSTGVGAVAGALFGRSPYGRLVGAVVGGAFGGAGSFYIHAKELATGKRWIPGRRQKERDINEYMDMLKFLKARRLYEDYSKQAKDKEGFNVEQFIKAEEIAGGKRKGEARNLLNIKRQLERKDISVDDALDQIGIDKSSIIESKKERVKEKKAKTGVPQDDPNIITEKDVAKEINKKINEIGTHREVKKIPPLAVKALLYYQQAETTMYGYDPGEPITNAMVALPKKEREFFKEFLKAPEEEKPEILSIAPRYMRRMLESTWGLPVEDKPKLEEYFQEHGLPGADWEGWKEDIPLEAVKVKLIKHEALESTEFGIWGADMEAGERVPVKAPHMDMHENANKVKRKLEDVLHGIGLENINISIEKNNTGELDIHTDIQKDKKAEIQEWLKEHGGKLLS